MEPPKTSGSAPAASPVNSKRYHYRFHLPHVHLATVFGGDWFALKAEAFARFFGTPFFLVSQTLVVMVWIGLNVSGVTHFDLYPFILLNLAFSLQAAYAAPLILLAQTRQADRDKAHAEADAQHREALAQASEERQILAAKENAVLAELLKQNTRLTEITQKLAERIEALTEEMHRKVIEGGK
jgi:uncharacterized membrane protein